MQAHEKAIWAVIEKVVGKTVTRMQRVWGVDEHGIVNEDKGKLQIEFEEGEVLLLKHGSNGDTPGVEEIGWIDPFSVQLDEETQQWLREVGKDALVDVSDRPPYSLFIHQPMSHVLPLFYQLGEVSWLCGFRFVNSEQQRLDFYYICDECYVGDSEALPQNVYLKDLTG